MGSLQISVNTEDNSGTENVKQTKIYGQQTKTCGIYKINSSSFETSVACAVY